MPVLRTLKLNCLLAALLPILPAIAVLLSWQWRAGETLAAQRLQLAAETAAAAGQALDAGESLAIWLKRHPAWAAGALVGLDQEGELLIIEQAGAAPRLTADAPPPELTMAIHQAQAWQDARLRAAAVVHDEHGNPNALVYIERAALPMPSWLPVLGGAGACLLGGVLMAWYLARRIYRPIVALHREAERALAGETAQADGLGSPETAAFASSICDLAAAVRSSRSASLGDEAPDSREATPGAYPGRPQE